MSVQPQQGGFPAQLERGVIYPCFDADWNARSDGNRLWDLVDEDRDEIPDPGETVILSVHNGPREMGEAMVVTVHDIRRPRHTPSAGWVVTFDWLVQHDCHHQALGT